MSFFILSAIPMDSRQFTSYAFFLQLNFIQLNEFRICCVFRISPLNILPKNA
ncbi:hypothetical protein KsCSTR_02820 [Candidatus Kuenenia stuttgartiensis]|uniref:Uncharacterized protein n=1 Tax=Kuenenia stuttgartiensis TaxID=174633 RepID=Q1PY35_KUEST|nr:hypothetical protein KsCSTR_02820 [Candidatus Kuenenia stuttgartiensis]CAJ72949.1 unknown protein [Candidatus Kuenenia stuttgartiensis]